MSRDIDSARPPKDYGRSIRVLARIILSLVGIVYVHSFWKILDFTWGPRSALDRNIFVLGRNCHALRPCLQSPCPAPKCKCQDSPGS
jgi:hypothetical protein